MSDTQHAAPPRLLFRAAPAPGRRRRGVLFRNELKALLALAGPIIVSQLGGIAMTTTDTIMVAGLGPGALAAAGIGTAIHVVALMFALGTLMGLGPLVSQAFGAGNRVECRRLLVQGLWLGALLSVPLTLASLYGGHIARLLRQDPQVAELAGGFLAALAPGILPTLLFAAIRQYLDSMSLPRVAMIITFVGVAVNVVGNVALIHGVPGVVPPLGVVGSGISTSVVRWTMLLVLGTWLLARSDLSPVGAVALRASAARMKRILAVGVPIGAQMTAEVGIFAFAAVMMGWLGPVQLAAHQVTINMASATFMVAVGASLAGSIRVGQHVGARNPRAVHRAALGTYLVCVLFMGACALAFLALPRFLIGLYTDDPGILRYGTALLFLAALFQLFDGAQVAGLQVLRGAADTRVPMLITILGYWVVGLPVAYWLGFHTPLAHVGIWAGLSVSLAVVALLLAWRVRLVLWKRPVPARAAPRDAADDELPPLVAATGSAAGD
jgi:MATE family multidrug resistance protein